jgi:hypothetical protein
MTYPFSIQFEITQLKLPNFFFKDNEVGSFKKLLLWVIKNAGLFVATLKIYLVKECKYST